MKKIRKFQKVCDIIESYDYRSEKLIPILQEIQEEYRYLPEEVMNFVATSIGVPPAKVFGVASFYSHFTLSPKGKYVVKICDGTACHVKKSMEVMKAMKDYLGLDEEKHTTDDMLFTLEVVSCLGTCGLAPAIMVNDKVYGLLDAEKVVNVLKNIQNCENINEETA